MSGPGKSKAKQELFAQYLANGMAQLEAYRAAGYNGGAEAASKKAKDPEVRARIDIIQDKFLDQLVIDRKWTMNQMVKNYYRAADAQMFGTCQAQLKDIGQVLNMYVERKDVRIHASFERMSDAELLQQLKTVTEQLAIADQQDAAAND